MKAVKVVRPPKLGEPPKSKPSPTADSSEIGNRILAGLEDSIKQLTRKPKAKAAKPVITRNEYPRIATLKLAGRSDKEIAQFYGMPMEKVTPHIRAALNAHRNGEFQVDMDQVEREAKAKAAENTAAVFEPSAEFTSIA